MGFGRGETCKLCGNFFFDIFCSHMRIMILELVTIFGWDLRWFRVLSHGDWKKDCKKSLPKYNRLMDCNWMEVEWVMPRTQNGIRREIEDLIFFLESAKRSGSENKIILSRQQWFALPSLVYCLLLCGA